MTDIYVSMQRGIYRHTIVGVASDIAIAHAYAAHAILDEEDHYHAIEIVQCGLDSRHPEEHVIDTLYWDKTRGCLAFLPTVAYATVNGVRGVVCLRRGRRLFLPWDAGRAWVLQPHDHVEVRGQAPPETGWLLLATFSRELKA